YQPLEVPPAPLYPISLVFLKFAALSTSICRLTAFGDTQFRPRVIKNHFRIEQTPLTKNHRINFSFIKSIITMHTPNKTYHLLTWHAFHYTDAILRVDLTHALLNGI
ncbi:TPA: hypothetical protein ACMDQ3_001465, partial [Vibrio cholerae]